MRPSFPKIQLSGLSPKLLLDIPSLFSPTPTQNRPPPRGSWLCIPGKENLKGLREKVPLPSSPSILEAWGDWQHGKEGLVIILNEWGFQDFFNPFFLCICFWGR